MSSLRRRQTDANSLTPIGVALGLTLGVAGVAAVALVVAAWLQLGRPDLANAKVADFLEAVKIALAVVAGVGGVVALVVAYRRQRIGEHAKPVSAPAC